MAERRGEGARRRWRCSRTSPTAPCRRGWSRRRRRRSRGTRGRTLGLGDGLVALRQGPLGNAAIVAATVVRAAGAELFVLTCPKAGSSPPRRSSAGSRRRAATGRCSYTGRRGRSVQAARSRPAMPGARLDTRGLSTGVHQVQVLATDTYGESTLTPPGDAAARRLAAAGDHLARPPRRPPCSVQVSDPARARRARRERQLRRRRAAAAGAALAHPTRTPASTGSRCAPATARQRRRRASLDEACDEGARAMARRVRLWRWRCCATRRCPARADVFADQPGLLRRDRRGGVRAAGRIRPRLGHLRQRALRRLRRLDRRCHAASGGATSTTDAVEEVAGGDAAMPSISEDGRYVSFTTNEGASLPEITHARAGRRRRTREAVTYTGATWTSNRPPAPKKKNARPPNARSSPPRCASGSSEPCATRTPKHERRLLRGRAHARSAPTARRSRSSPPPSPTS